MAPQRLAPERFRRFQAADRATEPAKERHIPPRPGPDVEYFHAMPEQERQQPCHAAIRRLVAVSEFGGVGPVGGRGRLVGRHDVEDTRSGGCGTERRSGLERRMQGSPKIPGSRGDGVCLVALMRGFHLAVWSEREVELIVADYFDMLAAEVSGRRYSKTEHRQLLIRRLRDRSESSIERKHQNISAVLVEMGVPYIDGYKPLRNYQRQFLPDKAIELLMRDGRLLDELERDAVAEPASPTVEDILTIMESAPERSDPGPRDHLYERPPQRPLATLDYLRREAANTKLGLTSDPTRPTGRTDSSRQRPRDTAGRPHSTSHATSWRSRANTVNATGSTVSIVTAIHRSSTP